MLQIHLLGGFRLVHDDAPVVSVNTPRLQSLLAYLLLHRAAPQPRQHLAFRLWPDSTEEQARTNLRKLLMQLRQAWPHADDFVLVDGPALQWQTGAPFTLDVAEFENAIAQAAQSAARRATLERAASIYGGDLLPGCYDDWITPERERLQGMLAGVLEQLVALLENQREYRAALQHAQRLLQLDSLNEAAYRSLMRLHALNGDPRRRIARLPHLCIDPVARVVG